MLTPGYVLQNRYRIVSPLGQGGMGAVYRAWDMRLSVPVALKEMTPQPGLNTQTLGQLRQQFQQEATVLARLIHPHLVRVTDFFEETGNAYLVMDLVEGENLAERINQRGPLPEAEVLVWAEQLLGALGYCHTQGIIHRDVKPQNVVIRPDGQAVLVDFGLVKLWDPNDPRTKTVMRGSGTPEYAPPEQYEADTGHTDPRSDIYSVGATLYHALVGQAPLTATLRMATPEEFRPVRGLNPQVSPATETGVMRALELARSKRWQTAAEMAAGLGIGGLPTPAQRPGRVALATPKREKVEAMPSVQAAAPARRRLPTWVWVLGAAVLAMVLLCVGSVWVLGSLSRRGQAIQTATAQAEATTTAQAAAATQAAQMTISAQEEAAAAATAQSAAATKAHATATVTPEAQSTAVLQAQATVTIQACVHDTGLAPQHWPVILCDTFGANVNDWYSGDYEGDLVIGEKLITGGRYQWDASALDGVIWWGIPDIPSVADVYLTVEVRRVDGVEDGQYGVIFRRADGDNYGLFKIEDSQDFKFSLRYEGEWHTVIDWTRSAAIRPGEMNRLTVLAEGTHYTFYINDQYVGEANDDRLDQGEAGIAIELLDADDTAVFEFDNFEVRAPE